jgi:hypothetical protein
MKNLTISGNHQLVASVFGVISEIIQAISTDSYQRLFTDWNNSKSDEEKFKELKKYLKRNIPSSQVVDSFKVCIMNFAGLNQPMIKIRVGTIKINVRLGFAFVINVKPTKTNFPNHWV